MLLSPCILMLRDRNPRPDQSSGMSASGMWDNRSSGGFWSVNHPSFVSERRRFVAHSPLTPKQRASSAAIASAAVSAPPISAAAASAMDVLIRPRSGGWLGAYQALTGEFISIAWDRGVAKANLDSSECVQQKNEAWPP